VIFELVKKVHSVGSFSDKEYSRKNALLTKEMLDKIGATTEHSPRKSLAQVKKQQRGERLKTFIYGCIR
jgi:hypothetical protein